MNTQLTEIAFILDRSGSMTSQVDAAIKGFNDFRHAQCDVPGQARFSLVLFDDQYDVTCASVPIREVVDLDRRTFVPRGSTALLDAIGRTIDELGARLVAMPEAARPAQVIVAILTDGEENSSLQFTLADISSRIAHQRAVYGWQFFFLGADQDAIATAVKLNIDQGSAMRFSADHAGYDSSTKAMSRKMSSLRKSSMGAPLSIQEEHDLKATLSDIGRDEEHRDKDQS
ncbi:MAG: VWA domain-containing protein [Chthoniobacterales bacterium]|nr:VWA domain-containing protein [Chthoniobacterales bacterium]